MVYSSGRHDPASVAASEAEAAVDLPECVSMSPSRQRVPPPVPPPPPVLLAPPPPPPPADLATLSPHRPPPHVLPTEAIAAATSPRRSKGVTAEDAWAGFVEALSAVLSEKDLLMISAETIRDLIRHYGFHNDAVVAAKIELHWKRLSGRTLKGQPKRGGAEQMSAASGPPPAPPPSDEERLRYIAAKSPPRDPRHTLHRDAVPPRVSKGPSPEAAAKAAQRQQRRQDVEREKELARRARPSGVPFGGGPAETPSEGPIGRRLESAAGSTRRRAVSPSASERRAPDRRGTSGPPRTPAVSDPNDASKGGDAEFLPYSKELRSVEYSETCHSQALVCLGRRSAIRDKNETVAAVADIGCASSMGIVVPGQKTHTCSTPAVSCDPNTRKDTGSSRRGGRSAASNPAQNPANSDPNAAGDPEGILRRPAPQGVVWATGGGARNEVAVKCLSVGPERRTAGCNPNEAGTGGQPQFQLRGPTHVYRSGHGARANPNEAVFNDEGPKRCQDAKEQARGDGAGRFVPDDRATAESNPNYVGSDARPSRLSRRNIDPSRRGGGGGAHSNPNAVVGPETALALRGPAGASGQFSPGLRPPSRAPATAAAASPCDPNDHPTSPQAHAVTASQMGPTAGLYVPPRKGGVGGAPSAVPAAAPQGSASDPNNTVASFQGPRSIGRRRVQNHPAAARSAVGDLLAPQG